VRAVYLDEGKITLREIDALSDEGIRVHVRSTGICGSDLHMLKMNLPATCVAGHEIAGMLDDGRAVAIEPVVPCDECVYCKMGCYNLCSQVKVLGITRNGGMADEVIVPERCLVYLPSTVEVKDACLVEPLAVAVHGMRLAGVKGTQRIAVIGGGAIGLCAVAVVETSGAEVGLAARYDHQMVIGSHFGAREIEGQYDLVVECAGTQKAIQKAINLCRSGGKLLVLGTHWEGVTFPQIAIMMKEITVVNSYMYADSEEGRDFDMAAALLSRKPEIAGSLITHRFPLADAEQAFSVAHDRKRGTIKVIMEP